MLHPNDRKALEKIIKRAGIRDVVAALADYGFSEIGNGRGLAEYVYHRMAETRAGIETHIATNQLSQIGSTDYPNAKARCICATIPHRQSANRIAGWGGPQGQEQDTMTRNDLTTNLMACGI